ncbi:MAG: glycosyltransferase [Actinobacteria bacterium]|uniref:Unannotated protein n=1 Tax=freshwater metagenome TaxID=449393 RepID=A0A6J7HX63_9ZZZZ|nr:glycosyltransferase [Actinomycetota bacterium]MTA76921.1 glycosyltransferase [Actinomycetota bacterium]
MSTADGIKLSVVVPIFNTRQTLRSCVEALLVAAGPDDQIILADDGSTDGAIDELTTILDNRVIRVASARNIGRGPIRNLGARAATREVLVFIDADVVVAPEALALIRRAFAVGQDRSALFGSYSSEPTPTGVVSNYRNLLHHFTHQHAGRQAGHFWTGIGAVRREVFVSLGGFDESHSGRELEDVEFGYRLVDAGYQIEVFPDIQGQHLKRYSVRSMVMTDLRHRAVPWSHMMLDRGFRPDRFATSRANAISAAAALLMMVALASAALDRVAAHLPLLAAGFFAFIFLLVNLRLTRLFLRVRGLGFTLVALPLHVVHSLTAIAGFLIACVQRTLSGNSAPDRSTLVSASAIDGRRRLTWHAPDRRMRWIIAAWVTWVVVAVFLVVNHEPWRDELQAWAIVRSAANPLQVLERLRGEGHPPLWYLILWPLAKISPSIVWLKVASLTVGASSAWLILRNLPVSFGARVLLAFGYFPLFELTAISRSYGLVLLLVLLTMGFAERRHAPNWVLGLLILLLLGTHALAIPIAVGLAIALWGGRLFASPFWARSSRGALGVCAGLGAAAIIYTAWSSNVGLESPLAQTFRARVGNVLLMPMKAAVPMPRPVGQFWGTFVVPDKSYIGFAVAVVLLIFVRRSRSARTFWVLSLVGVSLLVLATDRIIAPRFISVLWVAGLAAVWFASGDRRAIPYEHRSRFPLLAKAAIAVVLLGSLGGGLWATAVDIREPFSGARRAAELLATQIHGPAVVLCVVDAPQCSSVAIRLDVPAYMRAEGEPFTYVVWSQPNWSVLPSDRVRQQARKLERRTGAQVLIVSSIENIPAGCGSEQQQIVTPSIIGGRDSENFVVCSARDLAGE